MNEVVAYVPQPGITPKRILNMPELALCFSLCAFSPGVCGPCVLVLETLVGIFIFFFFFSISLSLYLNIYILFLFVFSGFLAIRARGMQESRKNSYFSCVLLLLYCLYS